MPTLKQIEHAAEPLIVLLIVLAAVGLGFMALGRQVPTRSHDPLILLPKQEADRIRVIKVPGVD